jgi:hypothetical protein
MNYYPIPGYPRYEIAEDRFTVRCAKPYKERREPFTLKPFPGTRCQWAAYVSVRDERDRVRSVAISKLAFLAFGSGAPELPDDLLEIDGFANYRYSPSERVVVRFSGVRWKPYVPHRIRAYSANRGGSTYVLMTSDLGKRVSVTFCEIEKRVKGGTL